jgi:hypothetical protein
MPDMQEGAIRAAGSHDIRLTETREIIPCVWVHPDEKRSRRLAPANYDSELSAVLIGHLR